MLTRIGLARHLGEGELEAENASRLKIFFIGAGVAGNGRVLVVVRDEGDAKGRLVTNLGVGSVLTSGSVELSATNPVC